MPTLKCPNIKNPFNHPEDFAALSAFLRCLGIVVEKKSKNWGILGSFLARKKLSLWISFGFGVIYTAGTSGVW